MPVPALKPRSGGELEMRGQAELGAQRRERQSEAGAVERDETITVFVLVSRLSRRGQFRALASLLLIR